MISKVHPSFLYSPTVRVVATWLWQFVGGALTVLAILAVRGVALADAGQVLAGERSYLAVYIEIVAVGLLPVLWMIACKDDAGQYCLQWQGIWKSILGAAIFVAIMFGIGYAINGQIMTDSRPPLQIAFPLNIWYGVLGIIAWGPLEVFFFTWLVVNTDRLFPETSWLVSPGLLITVLIFGALHVITTDLTNALYTAAIFFILGCLTRYSRNAVGPMLAWTLINGQVWYIARLLWG